MANSVNLANFVRINGVLSYYTDSRDFEGLVFASVVKKRTTSFSHERTTVWLRYASCLPLRFVRFANHAFTRIVARLPGWLYVVALAFNDSWNDLHQRFLSIRFRSSRYALPSSLFLYALTFFPSFSSPSIANFNNRQPSILSSPVTHSFLFL